ncbi:hypothetical protein BJ085DRAFT_36881 [Dimargaris cristalligena]|uniref:Uncharacterized protein n=1 Tax=Dimargaris cristalligena TaxID=215637 RepID=A0A4P9ZQZ8_9FUNG|nr:hypothetical protein BJ085DRAFT_36881 [Dimargaris cristalligena]|eukprot:RKP35161.1 hypothetical protein BJ085DRAFT_36881 [Dimargaris cristalligena]
MVNFQLWVYGLAVASFLTAGIITAQKQIRLPGDVITFADNYSIATNETTFEIDTVQVIDTRISQEVKFEGLPFEYSASKKQYPSKLGYVALFNLTTYQSTSTSLQTIIGGAVCEAAGVIVIIFATFLIRMSIRQRRYDLARASRRDQGIETLQATLKEGSAGPQAAPVYSGNRHQKAESH